MNAQALAIQQLSYGWDIEHPVIRVHELSVVAGEKVFIRGPSGSGKSTLLNLIGGVLRPSTGQLQVLGQSMSSLGNAAVDRLRADHIGFIFQQFNLLPYLSVLENVLLPCHFSALRRQRVLQQSDTLVQGAQILLQQLGLEALIQRDVRALSTGQQQRVAVARALLGAPELIIADEPTSALDSEHRDRFIELLIEQCDYTGAALLFVSHDMALQQHFSRTEALRPHPESGYCL